MKAGDFDLHLEANRVLARLLPKVEREFAHSINEDP